MTTSAPKRFFHLHLVSDATGETLNAVARAATAQYASYKPLDHIYALIRTTKQLARVLDQIEEQPGIVLFTLISPELRTQLETRCQSMGLPCISILDPVISILSQYLNAETTPQIAGQHVLNADYFRKIEALQFTMSHDDGQNPEDLPNADVIILGISRTSKTPTSIYLAQRGLRVANVPVVPGVQIPAILFELTKPLIVGLIASAERIAQIRRHRLLTLTESRSSDYADPRHITQEMMTMKNLCSKHAWPVIDVTRRSVEETSASVLNLLQHHQKTEE